MTQHTVILSMKDLKDLLDLETCIQLQETAFRLYGTGQAVHSPNAWLNLPSGRGWMKLLTAAITPEDLLVAKVGVRLPDLPPGGNHRGVLVLFRQEDGAILSIMNSTYVSAIRTGAGGGLAARYLARRDSTVMAVLGSGIQARFNVAAVHLAIPSVREIVVYSRSQENRTRFAQDIAEKLGMSVTPVDKAAKAVAEADILITATNSPKPVLQSSGVRQGMHINMMGSKNEVSPEVFQGAKIVVDSLNTAIRDGKVAGAIERGFIRAEDIHGELSEVVLGSKGARTSEDEVTIFDSSGIAVQDCTVASYAYRKALEENRGVSVDLKAEDIPELVRITGKEKTS